MIQRFSTPENVREWTSQAAKAGVTMLDWFGNPRMRFPFLYREMLRLSRLWKTLPALDIPASEDVAVIFSDDSRAAAGDEALHAHYTLHALLGEEIGAWFTFVGENQFRKGRQNLDGAKLIIAPQLAYVSKPFVEALSARVRDGATLIVFDPDALTHDIETGPLNEQRLRLIGMPAWGKRSASALIPTPEGKARLGYSEALPLRPMRNVGNTLNARALRPPAGAVVLLTYPDGQPAVYSREFGRGEVIVFGAMPFHDSELAIRPSGWDALFASLLDELGIKRDLPLWDFLFPPEGGEVEIHDLLIPAPPPSEPKSSLGNNIHA
jgi:hypothetical protein